MDRATILIVEDEPAIAESLQYALERAEFGTKVASTLARATQLRTGPDLILLDLMLPDGSGHDFIRTLRNEGLDTPIIVLSSREDEVDRITALEQGADDYVTKPFSPREVVARVRAVLRRFPAGETQDGLRLEHRSRQAFVDGSPLSLTRVEFALLDHLLTEPGRVYSRAELIDQIWGRNFAITDRTVDSHIKSLRRKIQAVGAESDSIQTVRGVGFRIASERTREPSSSS